MRSIFFALMIHCCLFSCHPADNSTIVKPHIVIKPNNGPVGLKDHRQQLVAELKKFQAAIASRDPQRIAAIFPFPLADTAFDLYIDDSIYLTKLKSNGNQLTHALFNQFFEQICKGLQVDEIDQLFKHINVDSLSCRDTLHYEQIDNKQPCYPECDVEFSAETLTLTYGRNTNSQYAGDDDVECGEYSYSWIFYFDGEKLNFVRLIMAG